MSILLVCGCALIATIVISLLKKYNSEYTFIVSVCAVSMVVLYVIASVAPSFDGIYEIFNKSGLRSNYLKIMLKCIGVCFLTEFTCDCCKDASLSALSNAVLIAGRLCVLFIALPLFKEFLDVALNLSGGSI